MPAQSLNPRVIIPLSGTPRRTPLDDLNLPIDLDLVDDVDASPQPTNLHPINLRAIAQAEVGMASEVALVASTDRKSVV